MSSHRGLSAVVGTVFLVAVVIGALSYVSYSMDVLGNFSESLIVEESRQKDKQNEAFEITSIDLSTATLNGVIKNTGELPVEITTLYIDEQGVDDVVQKYVLNAEIAPGTTIDLLDFANVPVDSTTGYNMKVVSSRGAVNSFYVNSNGQENIDVTMMAIPEHVVTGFDATLLMTVVNNMSNNNILVNLTPEDPYSNCSTNSDCVLVSGPTPASYDVLNAGDIAIFRWSYELSGDDGDSFTFTGAVQNGVPGNDDTAIVTVNVPEFAESSGVSLESLGFGQTNTIENIFVMHEENFGIPVDADYQLTPLAPDGNGLSLTFNDVSDSWELITSNVTATDAHFPAGNWNASLRYYNDHLPSGMDSDADDIWESGNDGGFKFHFEDISPSSGLYNSGEDSTCTWYAENDSAGNNGAEWFSTGGVNGSAAYFFDGSSDYLRAEGATHENCGNPHNDGSTISAWFRSTADTDHDDEQTIIEMWESSEGGYRIELSDQGEGHHGTVTFWYMGRSNTSDKCETSAGTNYIDGEWHHVVGIIGPDSDDYCKLYVDGVLIEDDDDGGDAHLDGDYDIFIGADSSVGDEFFGYIDDVLIWANYPMPGSDATALFGHSFGYNSTNMHFTMSNYTSAGVLLNEISYSNDYGMRWSDPGHYTDDWDEYRGGNYTVSLPETHLNIDPDNNRLGFTMEFASGEPLYMLIDDGDLDGSESEEYDMSSYIQPPTLIPPHVLPVYYTWNNDESTVEFFSYSAGNEGAWFTFQGTRIIFNGTNGNYAGLIDTIADDSGDPPVGMSSTDDSPFIAPNTNSDFVFYAPQKNPQDSPPNPGDRIPGGNYDVSIFLNGYDESGRVFVRSISVGTILVIEP